ncbi:MAG TPA: hypothetical protein VGE79_04430 [Niastella sp.]
MKKILVILCMLFACTGIGFAQTAPAKKDVAKKETKKAPAKDATAGPVKKDGTPDMRYKKNQAAADTTVKHKKKDGTADKRFKENKKS